MNFDLARRGVSAAQWHRSAESEGPRFDSSWALRICLYSTLVTRRKKTLSSNYHFARKQATNK